MHQPKYPSEAFTGPDTVVSQEKFDALVAIVERICMELAGSQPRFGSTTPDGWTRVKCPGVVFGGIQLPSVADQGASS